MFDSIRQPLIARLSKIKFKFLYKINSINYYFPDIIIGRGQVVNVDRT